MSGPLAQVLAAAAPGALLEAELIPLSNQGKVRVTYNWQYSALNCDPADGSTFAWTLTKLGATTVALSPSVPYGGKTLFASVRDDWGWFVQTQAPHSADWIVAPRGDEAIRMQTYGALIVSFTGFNGQAIAVNSALTNDGVHSGFRLQSTDSPNRQAQMFFLGVTQLLQPGFRLPHVRELTTEQIAHEVQAVTANNATTVAAAISEALQ